MAPPSPTGTLIPRVIPNFGWTTPRRYQIRRQPANTSDTPIQFARGVGIDLVGSGLTILKDSTDRPLLPSPSTPPSFSFTTMPSEVESSRADSPTAFTRPMTVGIMFGPTGRLDGLYINGERWQQSIDKINLLVGRIEAGIPYDTVEQKSLLDPNLVDFANLGDDDLADDEVAERRLAINWLNRDNMWVTVSARSGRAVTTEVDPIDPREIIGQRDNMSLEEQIAAQIISSRRFVEDMRGTGGR